MSGDVEETLRQEFREVASGVRAPLRPPLPPEPVRGGRLWRPLLVAAVTLIALGAVAVVSSYRDGGGSPQPAATPTESPSETPAVRTLTADPPAVPYVVDGRLHVGGERLPGSWWTVHRAGGAWTAHRDDDTWWWGTGAEQRPLSGTVILQPRFSPDGTLLAVGTTAQDGGQVLLVDTRSGEIVNTLGTDATGPEDPDAFGVVAVTKDARVFLQSESRRLMWLAAGDGGTAGTADTVDLDITAPGQWVQGSTPAGLIVYDGTKDGAPDASYLAEASDSGTLNRLRTLPGEDVKVNPSGTWLGRGGSWGGESETIPGITVESADGSRQLTLPPPDDRELTILTWEDDDLLLAELYTDGSPTGLARCSIREEECLVIDTP
ncbi:hypothetical protein [Streptomyces aidingensis]|uniref:WD40-like Beta Propeller Repeat n=1 Tax=Streptomyces aidingensis TaxID=910347 RepID=A0A1I1QVE4_9ACTN|nr:hypothetical protein [Streptomyces aidingensis]SFD25977.1 hypothetical protein SAMN05421773_11224 [Streptomyces aidingensis]